MQLKVVRHREERREEDLARTYLQHPMCIPERKPGDDVWILHTPRVVEATHGLTKAEPPLHAKDVGCAGRRGRSDALISSASCPHDLGSTGHA
jgi:hypothetical protein